MKVISWLVDLFTRLEFKMYQKVPGTFPFSFCVCNRCAQFVPNNFISHNEPWNRSQVFWFNHIWLFCRFMFDDKKLKTLIEYYVETFPWIKNQRQRQQLQRMLIIQSTHVRRCVVSTEKKITFLICVELRISSIHKSLWWWHNKYAPLVHALKDWIFFDYMETFHNFFSRRYFSFWSQKLDKKFK